MQCICIGENLPIFNFQDVIPTTLPPKINGVQKEDVEELFVSETEKHDLLEKSKALTAIELSKVDLQWLQVLSEGWASPLKGFMRQTQYLQSLHFKCLLDFDKATNQSVPIVLAIGDEQRNSIGGKNSITLTYQGSVLAIMENIEIFPHRKEERICRQFGTSHGNHPYIKMINDAGDWLVGGDLKVFERIKWNDGLDKYRYTPKELKAKFLNMKADVVYAFQLRNPIHNGHALLMKVKVCFSMHNLS